MNILIVTAHPAKMGFTHKIANTYMEAKKSRGDSVVIMDLYDKKWQQDFLRFEDIRDGFEGEETRKRIQAEITKADEIVFVSPMWWLYMPAIMKNFYDNNLSARFAFKYEAGRILPLPRPLLTGKTARIFMTADGPAKFYFFAKFALFITTRFGILRYCGIKTRSVDLFGSMRLKQNDKARNKILTKVAKRASR